MEATLTPLSGGHCLHLERMVIKGGRYKNVKFPALFFAIHHPSQGVLLFDTGYSQEFMRSTSQYPEKMYSLLTPVHLLEKQSAKNQLQDLNIHPNDVSYIFISHLHADHISALKDFPKAKFILSKASQKLLGNRNRWNTLINGYLPSVLPDDFFSRIIFFDEQGSATTSTILSPYGFSSWDLFKDKSIYAIPLPGHACGHSGLLVNTTTGPFFLIADACWMSRSYREFLMPAWPSFLIMDSKKTYKKTLGSIHRCFLQEKDLTIMPSHCGEVFRACISKQDESLRQMNGLPFQ